MAKACPKCSRPNNDRAINCIYCGAVFPYVPPPQKPEVQGEKNASRAETPRPESYLVIVSPQPRVGQVELDRFKTLLNLDIYTAKLKLKQPSPWVARTYSEMKNAQELSDSLIKLGIDSYVIKQSGLDKISHRLQATGIKRTEEDKIVFQVEGGKELELVFSDVFLIVQGKIKEKPELTEENEGYSPDGFNKPPSSSTAPNEQYGGVPRTVQQMSLKPEALRKGRTNFSGNQVQIMDVYRKSSPYPVRVVESEFDYSGLGDKKTNSGLLNYYYIYNRLVEAVPHVPIDSNFNVTSYTFPESPKEDKIRADLMTELGGAQRNRKIFDNRACFDDYSARIYLHHLNKNRKKKAQQESRRQG